MAATNINRVVLTGNLTRDPELRSTPSGTAGLLAARGLQHPPQGRLAASGSTSPTTSTSPSGARRARTAPTTSRRAARSRSTAAWSGASGRTKDGKQAPVRRHHRRLRAVPRLPRRGGEGNGSRFTPRATCRPTPPTSRARRSAAGRGVVRRRHSLLEPTASRQSLTRDRVQRGCPPLGAIGDPWRAVGLLRPRLGVTARISAAHGSGDPAATGGARSASAATSSTSPTATCATSWCRASSPSPPRRRRSRTRQRAGRRRSGRPRSRSSEPRRTRRCCARPCSRSPTRRATTAGCSDRSRRRRSSTRCARPRGVKLDKRQVQLARADQDHRHAHGHRRGLRRRHRRRQDHRHRRIAGGASPCAGRADGRRDRAQRRRPRGAPAPERRGRGRRPRHRSCSPSRRSTRSSSTSSSSRGRLLPPAPPAHLPGDAAPQGEGRARGGRRHHGLRRPHARGQARGGGGRSLRALAAHAGARRRRGARLRPDRHATTRCCAGCSAPPARSRRTWPPSGGDPRALVEQAEQAIFRAGQHDEDRASCASIEDVLHEELDKLERLSKEGQSLTGTPSGLQRPRRDHRRLPARQPDRAGGQAGDGQIALATNIAENAAVDHGKAVALFSLEMSEGELAQRFIASRGKIERRVAAQGPRQARPVAEGPERHREAHQGAPVHRRLQRPRRARAAREGAPAAPAPPARAC